MQPTDKERAHAPFYIEDHLYLDLQQLAPDELPQSPAWRHDTSSLCEDLIHLRELSIQSSHILASIRKQNSDIGHYLALLDKKIDILSQMTGTIALGGEIEPSHHVTLSTEGMVFEHYEALAVETPLRLKLVLFPSHLCLFLQSRVVNCSAKEEAYEIEVQFEQVGETEHEALIRHLLEKQSAELRRERSSRDE